MRESKLKSQTRQRQVLRPKERNDGERDGVANNEGTTR